MMQKPNRSRVRRKIRALTLGFVLLPAFTILLQAQNTPADAPAQGP